MRLLNTNTLQFTEYFEPEVPRYAILSHRWEADEVTIQDVREKQNLHKAGWAKVRNFCAFASSRGFALVWIDTGCIDKMSSADLSEAINSMFRWYQNSDLCVAYLCDVEPEYPSQDERDAALSMSKWFTRGWTLQELIAPREVLFVASDWTTILGNKAQLVHQISQITRIGKRYITGKSIQSASIAKRMSWAALRKCTRQEDIAYCLIGLFGVQMPLLYGEGTKAFLRLQLEIIKTSNDESIFAWDNPSKSKPCGLFATSPTHFWRCGTVSCREYYRKRPPYVMTNRGLQIELSFVGHSFSQKNIPASFPLKGRSLEVLLVPLNCGFRKRAAPIFIALRSAHSGGPSLRYGSNVSLKVFQDSIPDAIQFPRHVLEKQNFYVWQEEVQQAYKRAPLGTEYSLFLDDDSSSDSTSGAEMVLSKPG